MAKQKPYQYASHDQIVEALSKLDVGDLTEGENLIRAKRIGQSIHHDLDGDIDPDMATAQRWGQSRFTAWLRSDSSNDRFFANIVSPPAAEQPAGGLDENGLWQITPTEKRAIDPADIEKGVAKWVDQQWALYDDQHKEVVEKAGNVLSKERQLSDAKEDKKWAMDDATTTAQRQAAKAQYNPKIKDANKELDRAKAELELAEDEYDGRFADVIDMAREQERAGKALITIDPGNPALLIEQVIDQLADASNRERVFNYNGCLAFVKPHHVPLRYAREGQGFFGTITPYDVNSLSVRIAEQMYFVREIYGPKASWIVPATIDQRTVSELLSRTWTSIPALRSVGFSPVVTAEGVLLDEPRFYPEYGIELRFNPDHYRDIGDSDADALTAYQYLDEILDVFDFCLPSDRAAAHLCLATLAISAGFDALTPLISIQSVNPMSGKTLLAQTIAAAGTGMVVRPTPWKDNDDELSKLITSLLYEGAPVVLFDNLKRGAVVQSPIIDALVTGGGWRDRILGHSKTDVSGAKVPIIIVNGNNISFGGDSMTRGIRINLNLPEGELLFDPCERVIAKRPDVIRAVLTIIKAGLRRQNYDLGTDHFRFPAWNGIIRAAYVHGKFGRYIDIHGKIASDGTWEAFLDPIPVQKPGSSATDAPLELDMVLRALKAVFGVSKFTCSEIFEKVNDTISLDTKDTAAKQSCENNAKLKQMLVNLADAEMPHARNRTGEINLTSSTISRLLSGQTGREGGNFILHKDKDKWGHSQFWVEG